MFIFKKKKLLHHRGTKELETDRFILRQFKHDDASDAYKNWTSDKEAARYNAWSIHKNLDDTKAYISGWISMYKDLDYYHWAITIKGTGEVIGSVTVSNIRDWTARCEVGYTVARKYWNLGIATECLKRVIAFLTEEVGFRCVGAMHDVRNTASGRVMEKAGMKYVKRQKQFFLNSASLFMDCRIYEYKAENDKSYGKSG